MRDLGRRVSGGVYRCDCDILFDYSRCALLLAYDFLMSTIAEVSDPQPH